MTSQRSGGRRLVVAVEADATAACFLLFPAGAPAAVPSPCFLLGSMEVVAMIEMAVSLVKSSNGKKAR